ncbi:MAG TPA: glutathione peroxidase [Burkholderiaceae bacterium]|nr:glutathione peroxidase [Burkholderiaceae bacterium]
MTKTIVAACMVLWMTAPGLVKPAHAQSAPQAQPPACTTLFDVTVPRLQDDVPQRLCQYAGQVALVVNTASFCGFTGQYQELEALYEKYRRRGFVVLGFPSNDFGQQEPGSNRDIADFCFNTYAVRFPMFAKTTVVGPSASPLYLNLSRQAGPPRWNFHKYLIGRDGRIVASFPSQVTPLAKPLTQAIERLL